ncbi:hypothetical protein NPIL_364061, partial [Nephila pilipes]
VQKDAKEYFGSTDFKRNMVCENGVQNSQKEYGWLP